jgi:hypothetical protein
MNVRARRRVALVLVVGQGSGDARPALDHVVTNDLGLHLHVRLTGTSLEAIGARTGNAESAARSDAQRIRPMMPATACRRRHHGDGKGTREARDDVSLYLHAGNFSSPATASSDFAVATRSDRRLSSRIGAVVPGEEEGGGGRGVRSHRGGGVTGAAKSSAISLVTREMNSPGSRPCGPLRTRWRASNLR